MKIIVSNRRDCDPDEFTKVCSSIEEFYEALCEVYDKKIEDHIHFEFCTTNSVGNNESANYCAIIEHVTRF